MSNVHEISNQNRPYQEATAWLSKLDRGLTSREEEELRTWLQANASNANLFLEAAQMWDNMTALSRLSDLFPESADRRTQPAWFAVAASVMIAVGVAFWALVSLTDVSLSDWPEHDGTQTVATTHPVYETVVGEQSSFLLADGSKIVLNTDSRLTVHYTEHHRMLILSRGEMHVEVARDVSRPLSVVVGDNIIQALGTAFGVEITQDNDIELVVTEGKVRVATRPNSATDTSQRPAALVLPSSSLTVVQGEELLLGTPSAKVKQVTAAQIAVKLSWRDGNLIFSDDPLEEAMQEVERYTTIQFVFLDESLKQESISGRYKAGDVDTLLGVLRENIGVAYERTDDGRVLLRKL